MAIALSVIRQFTVSDYLCGILMIELSVLWFTVTDYLYVKRNDDTTRLCYKSCDDDEEEEEDNDDMEYTEDAIDNMILEFSGD